MTKRNAPWAFPFRGAMNTGTEGQWWEKRFQKEESTLLIKQKAVAWRRGHDINRSGCLTYLTGEDRKRLKKFKKVLDKLQLVWYNKFIRWGKQARRKTQDTSSRSKSCWQSPTTARSLTLRYINVNQAVTNPQPVGTPTSSGKGLVRRAKKIKKGVDKNLNPWYNKSIENKDM